MNQFCSAMFGLALLAGCVSAQSVETCYVTGVPTTVRASGAAELLGDIVINCMNGTPTPAGMPVPMENFQISINANITGRLFPSLKVSDALMIIDDAFPANPIPPSAGRFPGAPPQILCTAVSTYCAEVGTGGSPSPYQTQPNVFIGQQTGINELAFNGIPIDAPGPNTRTIRITNLRADVSALGPGSGLLPVEINAIVSVSGDATLNIEQSTGGVALGIAQSDLYSSITAGPALLQCQPHNASLLGGSGTAAFDFGVHAEEGFPSVFQFRNYGTIVYGNEYPQQVSEQNVPGFAYDTESGFYSPSLLPSVPNIGLADFGTRIMVQFENVAAGTHLFVPVGIVTKNVECSPSTSCPAGKMHLVKAGKSGNSVPGYSPVPATATVGSTKVAEVSYSGATAYAVYEVTDSDPTVTELATIPVAVAFDNSAVPAAGTATAAISFAPISSSATASATAPLPRFGNPAMPRNAYTINSCPAVP